MLSIFHKLFVLSLSIFVITSSFSATPVSTIEIPVSREVTAPTPSLLTEALAKVIIRLTGNPQITEQPSVKSLLKDPNSFLENYKQQDMPSRLILEFDQSAIIQALNKANIDTWTEQKPTLLLWWLTTQQGTNSLLDDSQTNANIIQKAAAQQGFPIQLPLADLTEQTLTDKTIFNAAKPDAIFQASIKYNAHAILAVYANQTIDKWQLNWRLWQTSNSQLIAEGRAEGRNLTEASSHLFTSVNPPLAKIYIIPKGEVKKITITIKQINFSRYVQISKLMNSFHGRLLETNGSTARYELTADPLQLQTQLELLHFYPEQTKNQPIDLVFVSH